MTDSQLKEQQARLINGFKGCLKQLANHFVPIFYKAIIERLPGFFSVFFRDSSPDSITENIASQIDRNAEVIMRHYVTESQAYWKSIVKKEISAHDSVEIVKKIVLDRIVNNPSMKEFLREGGYGNGELIEQMLDPCCDLITEDPISQEVAVAGIYYTTRYVINFLCFNPKTIEKKRKELGIPSSCNFEEWYREWNSGDQASGM